MTPIINASFVPRSFHWKWRWSLTVLLLLVGSACQPPPSAGPAPSSEQAATHLPASPSEDSWQVLTMQGAKIGYTHLTVTPVRDNHRDLVRIESDAHISVERFGATTKQTLRVASLETSSGDLIRFDTEEISGPTPVRGAGQVVGDELRLSTTGGEKTRERTIPWSSDIKGLNAEARSLREKPMQPGETRTIRMIEPSMQQAGNLKMTARELETTKLLDGERSLLHIDSVMQFDDGQAIPSVIWTDEQGEVLKTALGPMESFATTREVAMSDAAGAPADVGVSMFVKVDHPLAQGHASREARYRVTLDSGDPKQLFVESESQHVESIDAHTAEITVRAIRPGAEAGAAMAKPADLAASEYIECDDPDVVRQANEAAGDLTDPWQTVVALEHYVRRVMANNVNFTQTFATAADVARHHEGDCTEHAVLLVALARARKIPARAAIGVVYMEPKQAFGFHMWAEVLIGGRWIPMDGTLGQGGIGAGHLTQAENNLDSGSPAGMVLPLLQTIGQLKIDVLESK